ncbi:hypothetical protein GS506_10725 [Rhodococcus hoagii]|nr:hypothetical protein [Prescottella equi]
MECLFCRWSGTTLTNLRTTRSPASRILTERETVRVRPAPTPTRGRPRPVLPGQPSGVPT